LSRSLRHRLGTSTNGGSTWTHGFLPGITKFQGSGPYDRVSDPSVAFDLISDQPKLIMKSVVVAPALVAAGIGGSAVQGGRAGRPVRRVPGTARARAGAVADFSFRCSLFRRCGLYAAIEGTLDSLSGYLSDSAHDRDPAVYAQVACTGRVFVDVRGVRAQRIEVLRLATSGSLCPDPGLHARAVAELSQRYRVEVCGLGLGLRSPHSW
jgi:hypothetical protein